MGRLCEQAATQGLIQLGMEVEAARVVTPQPRAGAPVAGAPPQKLSKEEAVAQGKSHHEAASRFFDVGNFDGAVAEWTAAYEIDPRPGFLFNIASCYRRRGEIDGQISDLRRARHFLTRFIETSHEARGNEALKSLDEQIAKMDGKK
jgi:hypothetical protein